MNKALLIFLLFPLFSAAQRGREVTVFTIDSFTKDPGRSYDLLKHWRFHDGDAPEMSSVNYNDSNWAIVEPSLPAPDNTKGKQKPFNGAGWFRLHMETDTGVTGLSLSLRMTHLGASEVYVDGKKIISFGVVNGRDSSVYVDPQWVPFPIVLRNAGEHVIAVRYANYNAQRNSTFFHTDFAGIRVEFGESKYLIQGDHIQTKLQVLIDMFLFGIFIAIASLHLFLYLYHRELKTNLFFSIFSLSLGLLFLIFFLDRFSTNPVTELASENAMLIVVPAACLSLSGFINQLYSSKKWGFRLMLALSILAPVIFLINPIGGIVAFISLVLAVTLQVIIVTSWAIYKKQPGAYLLGVGVLFFSLFIFICSVWTLIFHELSLNDNTVAGIVMLFFTVAAILILPVSISLFLAWNFATISKDLKYRLNEVRRLSEKTLEQEVEKKRMLENQKGDLEREVAIRTSEVVAQKDKIERQHAELMIEKERSEILLTDIQVKNKEITDNITYAKRIQSAILPDINLIYKTLEDSFILYLPKDIVSGDFYAFAEKNNKVLIIAGDCTGHGVSGALMSMIGGSLLNQIITEKGVEQPAMILDQLNSAVIETFRQGENEANDGMDVSVCSIDLNTKRLQYAGANRPLWLVRDHKIEVFRPDKFPIGGLQAEKERRFTNSEIVLQKNDAIYIFTDGYADQFGGEKGKKLMTARFKELLISIGHMGMRGQEAFLKEYFEQWKGVNEQVDDVLVIGVRV